MPCKDALVKKVMTVSPDMSVEQALKDMKKSGLFFAPVVDSDGTLVGLFSVSRLLENTLPVSVALASGGAAGVNVMVPSAPGMAKRLQKYRGARVSEMMQRQFGVVDPDMSLESAVRLIRETGEPAVVVDGPSGAFQGVVTAESVLEALEKMGA